MTIALAKHLPSLRQVRPNERLEFNRWTGVLAHAFAALIVGASLNLKEPTATLTLGGAVIFPLYLWLCWREGCRVPLCVSPLSFLFFWNSIVLGVCAIYIASQISGGQYIPFVTMQVSPSDVAHGYALYLAGIASLHFGMEVLRPMPGRAPFGGDLPFDRPLAIIVAGFAVGLLYLFRQNWFALIGAAAAPFSHMAVASVCLLALLPHWYLGLKRHVHRALVAVSTLLATLGSMNSGSKAYIMFAFLPLIWAMIARKELRRNLIYACVVFPLLYTGLVAPTIAESRGLLLGKRQANYYEVFWTAAQDSPLLSGDWNPSSYEEQFQKYLSRMYEPISVAFLVQEVALKGLQYGETMKYATYALIPRVLWPGKPNVSRGAWFTAYLGFSPRAAEATTSTGITAVGELYWNFGISGVLVGMCFIGMLFGQVWRMAGQNPVTRPLHLLLYVYLTLAMSNLPEAVTVIAGTLSLLILFGSVFFVLQTRSSGLQDSGSWNGLSPFLPREC